MSKYKNHIYLAIVFALIALAHTLSYEDEQTAENFDPSPCMNNGLGCITDSECEGIERAGDNLPLSPNLEK